MATSPDERKAALLEATIARVHERVEGDQADQVERFVRAYYAHVAPDDLSDRSDLDLYGAAAAHWNLARVRQPGELKVHVYTPNLEEHGWESRHTVVETVVDDMPFLVDSVSMAVTRSGGAIHLVIRQIMRVRRDEEGRLLEVGAEDGQPESLIHVEIDRQTSPEALERLRAGLSQALGDVRAAVEDWPSMRERVRDLLAALDEAPPPVAPDELAEARDLLEWIHDDHFTFLGYREYDILDEDGEDVLRAVSGSGLGILRAGDERPISLSFAQLTPEVRRLAREKSLLSLTKANSRATVHRPAYLDYVGVKRFDADGRGGRRAALPRALHAHRVQRERRGRSRSSAARSQRVVDRSGLQPGSHDHKALVEIIETYPRDELFQISEDELFDTALGILHLDERRRVRLFVRRDAFGRFFSCLVYLPRERFDTKNRGRIQEILQHAFGGVERRLHDARVRVGARARPRRRLHGAGSGPGVRRRRDRVPPRRRRRANWTDDLRDALSEQLGEDARRPALRTLRRGVPRRLPRGLHRPAGGARHRADRAARPGRRPRA